VAIQVPLGFGRLIVGPSVPLDEAFTNSSSYVRCPIDADAFGELLLAV
jgi:hypothetical protein